MRCTLCEALHKDLGLVLPLTWILPPCQTPSLLITFLRVSVTTFSLISILLLFPWTPEDMVSDFLLGWELLEYLGQELGRFFTKLHISIATNNFVAHRAQYSDSWVLCTRSQEPQRTQIRLWGFAAIHESISVKSFDSISLNWTFLAIEYGIPTSNLGAHRR